MSLAAAALASFHRAPYVSEVGKRYAWYRRFLWCASFLFVAGMFVTRANFELIFAHAPAASQETRAALNTLRDSFLLQVGVGYTVILFAVFLPVRVLLEHHLRVRESVQGPVAPRAAFGISASWHKDSKDLLAIATPLISIPAMDVLGK